MSMNQDQLERLICRKLDGMMTEDEELSLNRELIRNPEARAMMVDYERADRLAAEALSASLGSGEPVFSAESIVSASSASAAPKPRGVRPSWLLVPGAIAAALLALAMPLTNENSSTGPEPLDRPTVADGSERNLVPDRAVPRVASSPDLSSPSVRPRMQSAGTGGLKAGDFKTRRYNGKDWLGVQGTDGNFYWIEFDRTQTVRTPRREPRTMLSEM